MEQKPRSRTLHVALDDRIDLIGEQVSRGGGVMFAVTVSLVIHSLLVLYAIRAYHPAADHRAPAPIVRYVELMQQDPRQFVEAPGPKQEKAPSANAPLSDANRKASMPEPTGTTRTTRPGEGGAIWSPPSQPGTRSASQSAPSQQQQQQQQQQQPSQQPAAADGTAMGGGPPAMIRRQTPQPPGGVDWGSAIRRAAQGGGGNAHGADLGGVGGGEKGFAESGPLSFESQWYDWGDYAEGMVSRIRVNWYGNMPELIKTGLKGVVTIRFTIHRNGAITDVTILNSSGIPPYDNAAKHAIELSSPLRPLPADFPNDTERVTCMFYYNMEIPGR